MRNRQYEARGTKLEALFLFSAFRNLLPSGGGSNQHCCAVGSPASLARRARTAYLVLRFGVGSFACYS